MSDPIHFKGASQMPMISVSFGHMDWNKTGAWRAQRPFYEDKTPHSSQGLRVGKF